MKKHLLLALGLACALVSQASGKTNHTFFTGPLKTGPEVTRACIECHPQETKEIMNTVHWNWSKKQSLNGKTVEYGKKNALSNFYSAVPSNWQECTRCHAGYGWTDSSFDFSKAENIDCLVCHETTGTYRKGPGGLPLLEGDTKEVSPPKESVTKAGLPLPAADAKALPRKGAVDLVTVARSVERPSRAACGFCHFYGCGEDGMKHGDLDSSLANPTPDIDIHMGGKKFTCESCHKAAKHDVRGEAVSVSLSSSPRVMGCSDCHKGAIHPSAALNMHLSRVACQTCHVPEFAKMVPTVTWWNWTGAGKEKPKGEVTSQKNLKPTYFWYNGSIERVVMGDKIDPSKVVKLSAPKGERKDPNARIFPFKVMRGKQPYDAGNNTVAVVNMAGAADSTSERYDWNKGIAAGMKGAGQPYSGKYGWIETSTAWSLNHMVAPKEKALTCPDCHVPNGIGRIDWKAMGYPEGDPR